MPVNRPEFNFAVETSWDGVDLEEFDSFEQFAEAHVWHNVEDPKTTEDVELPVVNFEDGDLKLVYEALNSAHDLASRAVEDEEDVRRVRTLLEELRKQEFPEREPLDADGNAASLDYIRSISEEEVSDCISEKVDEGVSQDQAVAICLSEAEEGSTEPEKTDSVEDVDTVPTQEMADVASEVLEKIDNPEFENDECGTRVGLERANQLENREELSPDTISRMVSFFARHDGNQTVDDDVDSKWEDCGFVAWQLWGGDPGREWAERKQEEIEEAEQSDEKNTMDKSKDLDGKQVAQKRLESVQNTKGVRIKENDDGDTIAENVPIQATTEDRDGDIITEEGQKEIVEQLEEGTVPLFLNHGVGSHDAHYDVRDIIGHFIGGKRQDGKTFADVRLLENDEDAEKLQKLMENDMPVGFSVGFIPQETETMEEGGEKIFSLDLMETSAVGIPSNADSVINPMKSGEALATAVKNMVREGVSDEIVGKVASKAVDTMSENKESDGSKSGPEQVLTEKDIQNLKQVFKESLVEHKASKISEKAEGDVTDQSILEFTASHFEGMDVADLLDAVDSEGGEYVGSLNLPEVAALLADRMDMDQGSVMDALEELDGMETEGTHDDEDDDKTSDHIEGEDEKSESSESEQESTADKNKGAESNDLSGSDTENQEKDNQQKSEVIDPRMAL